VTILRPGLLHGRSVAFTGEVPAEVGELISQLGARVVPCDHTDEQRTLEWVRSVAPIDALVCGSGELPTLDDTWVVIRAVADGALIPSRAGAIVLLAPRRGAVAHGEAVGAALENLARTLSVEWARYGITTAAIAPGSNTGGEEIATLVAFLCSIAGAYFSGCRFALH
jgi:NAD(P)-dependent dehydrogenase (short-subunit alcohol dehydrogenase family)